MQSPDGMRLLLLGDPVSHSRSPVMHAAALASGGIAGTYVARRVDRVGMDQAAVELKTGLIDGANITMPHKELAFELCDHADPDATRARSVNTWVAESGIIAGYSTDIVAVRRLWEEREFPTGPVVILGAGGAAAAVLVALESLAEPIVVARRSESARDLILTSGIPATIGVWGNPVGPAAVVNCTPIGMVGDGLPRWAVGEATALFDMAYGAIATPAVEEARARGIRLVDGIDLLVAQAEASFELWTGQPAPADAMRTAVTNISSVHRDEPNHA